MENQFIAERKNPRKATVPEINIVNKALSMLRNTNMKESVGNAVCASISSDTQYKTTFSHSQSGALENRTSTAARCY